MCVLSVRLRDWSLLSVITPACFPTLVQGLESVAYFKQLQWKQGVATPKSVIKRLQLLTTGILLVTFALGSMPPCWERYVARKNGTPSDKQTVET